MRWRPRRLRTRLTLWYCLVLGLMLLVFIIISSFFLRSQLRAQLQRFVVEDLETIEGLLFFDNAHQLQLREDYHNHPESREVFQRLLEVRDPSGVILYKNSRLGTRNLGGAPFAHEGVGGYSERSIHLEDGTPVMLASRRHVLNGRPILIRVGYSELSLSQRLQETMTSLLLALPLVLALAGAAGYWLARRALSPLEEMAVRAEHITPDRLHERLPVDETGELGHLARVFNATLARLEQAFEQLRRFTSDASHELRTPLTALRSVGEVGLQKSSSPQDFRDIIGSMLEEVNRLTRLIDNLLTIARADAGSLPLNRSSVSLQGIVNEAMETIGILAEEKEQQLQCEGAINTPVLGDTLFLRQALMNVLHNAVKYSPVGGTIKVLLRSSAEAALIEIADSGPGIADEHRNRIFDRFYRVDQSRVRNGVDGTGLGLAIAQWAVRQHGGSITVNTSSMGGACFRIMLPIVATGSELPPHESRQA